MGLLLNKYVKENNLKNLMIYPLLLNVILNVPICFGGDNTPRMIKIGNEYIERWSHFYPSQALYEGMIQSIYNYEDLSETSIKEWLEFNKEILNKIYKHEADFTDMDLPVREVKKSSLREPMMDIRDNDEELEKLQTTIIEGRAKKGRKG